MQYLATEIAMDAFKSLYNYYKKQYQTHQDIQYFKQAQWTNQSRISLPDAIRSSFDAEENKLKQLEQHSTIFDNALENILRLDSSEAKADSSL